MYPYPLSRKRVELWATGAHSRRHCCDNFSKFLLQYHIYRRPISFMRFSLKVMAILKTPFLY